MSILNVEQPAVGGERIAPNLHAREPSQTTSVSLLSADGLCKSYNADKPIFSNISLDVKEGETVALIGSNGAGKSTLLKCFIGVLPNNGGEISIFGNGFSKAPSAKQAKQIRSDIGFVFQKHSLVARATALTNVVHGLLGRPGSWRGWHHAFAQNTWREAALDALDSVNLAHKANERVDQLSGGQAQRVAIARALVRKPKLFIADEPAASLDPKSGHEVMQRFVDLAKKNNITLMFTSHDMQHALQYAERVIALKSGSVFLDQNSIDLTPADLKAVFDG